jgi:hypothetical protein
MGYLLQNYKAGVDKFEMTKFFNYTKMVVTRLKNSNFVILNFVLFGIHI